MIFITFPSLLHLILYIGFSVSLLIHLSFILFIFSKDFLWDSLSHWRTQDFVKAFFSYISHSSLLTETIYTYLLYIDFLKKHPASFSLRYVSSEIFPGVLKSPSCGSSVFQCCGLDGCCCKNHWFQDFLVTFTKLPYLLLTHFSPSIKPLKHTHTHARARAHTHTHMYKIF